MLPTLLALVSAVSGLGGVGIGIMWMHAAKGKGEEHEHSWGQWEDCQLRDHWRWNADHTEYIPVVVDGQRRECITCCEKQIRKLTL